MLTKDTYDKVIPFSFCMHMKVAGPFAVIVETLKKDSILTPLCGGRVPRQEGVSVLGQRQ